VGSDIADSAFTPQGRDAQQLLDEAEAKIFQIAEKEKHDQSGFKDIKELLPQVAQRIDDLFTAGASDVTGVPTGFSDLDAMTSGLQPGDLVIVAGRPSMGKTSLALNMAENVALDTGLPSCRIFNGNGIYPINDASFRFGGSFRSAQDENRAS